MFFACHKEDYFYALKLRVVSGVTTDQSLTVIIDADENAIIKVVCGKNKAKILYLCTQKLNTLNQFPKITMLMNNNILSDVLLKRIAKNDSKAFTEFYDLYFDKIYRIAYFYIKSATICEEIVSDVFMSVWQSGSKLLSIENIDSYLYITTRNRAFYYNNKTSIHKHISVEDIPFETLFHTESPEELSISKEFLQKIDEAIHDLPERCREIFLLAREDGLKYKEIAEKLSISEKTVNAQMVTAIKRVSNALRQFISILF